MSYDLGTYVKRNAKIMIYPTINTTNDVKMIAAGNEYEVVGRRTAGTGYVYSIKSVQTGVMYDVANCDMKDFFEIINNPTQKPAEKQKVSTVPKIEKPCVCESLDLFRYGCRCGAIENCLELKYRNMLNDRLGPEKQEE
jgi:hypothetical protein